MTETVLIEKLVHGGQGIGTLADGRRVFVWNVLPGETVQVRLTKNKNKLAEGIAEAIITPSTDRVEPKDDLYLSTSPWQMMSFAAENRHKQAILTETLAREHVMYDGPITMHAGDNEWQYRNKMEYSFWADDYGLHLALYNRGTHQKQILTGSSIAMPVIDRTAQAIVSALSAGGVRGSQLKTVVIRANQQQETVAALFVKDESFPDISALNGIGSGLVVYYSNPKSPASVATKELYRYGDISVSDTVLGNEIAYDVNSFFQVNLEIFEVAAKRIAEAAAKSKTIVDMYAGVGTIGLSVGAHTLVDIDAYNSAMATKNVGDTAVEVIHASAERALEHIPADGCLIVDPPRAGLHAQLITTILGTKPAKVIYLSCNPITQARDIALLQGQYKVSLVEGYNFFPKTPHIESLVVLERI